VGWGHGIAGNAAAHVLEADLARGQRLAPLRAAGKHEMAHDIVRHEREKFVEALVLVVVAVHVDDQNVVKIALLRLLARMGEQLGRVELFDGDASSAVGEKLHGVAPDAGGSVRECYADCCARESRIAPGRLRYPLVPAKAGTQIRSQSKWPWIPA